MLGHLAGQFLVMLYHFNNVSEVGPMATEWFCWWSSPVL